MPEQFVRQDLAAAVAQRPLLQWAGEISDRAAVEDVYRNKEGRKTLRFRVGEKSYFLKLHLGIGWREIVKNLLQLRLPILGAKNEYRAVEALQQIGVDTMSVAAYVSEGKDPAHIHSLIITDDLVGTISLEDYCANWAQDRPLLRVRLRLLNKVAESARKMHGAGINHRDFYICHFHLDEKTLNEKTLRCYLIDLHRAQIRSQVPHRWLVKDLGGLYFSALDCGLTRRDLLRFIKAYSGGDLRAALADGHGFWAQVESTATKLYVKDHGKLPDFHAAAKSQ